MRMREKIDLSWTTHTSSERDRASPSSYCNAEVYSCSIIVQSVQQILPREIRVHAADETDVHPAVASLLSWREKKS